MWGSAYIVQAHGILAIRTFSQGLDPGNSVRTERTIEEQEQPKTGVPTPWGSTQPPRKRLATHLSSSTV